MYVSEPCESECAFFTIFSPFLRWSETCVFAVGKWQRCVLRHEGNSSSRDNGLYYTLASCAQTCVSSKNIGNDLHVWNRCQFDWFLFFGNNKESIPDNITQLCLEDGHKITSPFINAATQPPPPPPLLLVRQDNIYFALPTLSRLIRIWPTMTERGQNRERIWKSRLFDRDRQRVLTLALRDSRLKSRIKVQ